MSLAGCIEGIARDREMERAGYVECEGCGTWMQEPDEDGRYLCAECHVQQAEVAMLSILEGDDWAEAFQYAGEIGRVQNGRAAISSTVGRPATPSTPFSREDVIEIIGHRAGENDEENWLMFGRLRDGRYFFLSAWCDYTGWDCQAGGSAVVSDDRSDLVRFGLTDEARQCFGL